MAYLLALLLLFLPLESWAACNYRCTGESDTSKQSTVAISGLAAGAQTVTWTNLTAASVTGPICFSITNPQLYTWSGATAHNPVCVNTHSPYATNATETATITLPSGTHTDTITAGPFPNKSGLDDTGYLPTGVTLSACSTVASNTTYDSCLFSGGVDISNKVNVVITRSKILGIINPSSLSGDNNQSGGSANLTMKDVEIDGNGTTSPSVTNGIWGASCIRCKIHNANGCWVISNTTVGVGGQNTLQDSYCFDNIGHDGNPNTQSHMEEIQGTNNQGWTLDHNYLKLNLGANDTGSAPSAVLVYYSHPSFWKPVSNVTGTFNLIENDDNAVYCAYMGNSCSQSTKPTSMKWWNNIEVQANCAGGSHGYIGWHNDSGATNLWAGNAYDDVLTGAGTAIAEPADGCY